MWSKELQETSKMCFQSNGMVFVKSFEGENGMLFPNNRNKIYSISILSTTEYGKETGETKEFHSIDDMIEAGWVID